MIAARHESRSRIEAAGTDPGLEKRAISAACNDINHAPDRIGAKQRGTSALDDLDALDHFGGNVLNGSATQRAGIDAHTVDEHERVVTFGTAHEDRCRLARSAIATDVDARLHPQQFGKVSRHRQFDLFAGDDRDRHDRIR